MYRHMKFIILVLTLCRYVDGFDCYSYAMSLPETEDSIDLKNREIYLTKLCSATTSCHDTPVFKSFEAYADDVISCYSAQMFNFDTGLFDVYQSNITNYINAINTKRENAQHYDLMNIRARDEMNGILDTVRLRDSYLREFRYSQSKNLFGDIELQLEHKCHRFILDAQNQLEAASSFSFLTFSQLNTMKEMSVQVLEAIRIYEESELALTKGETIFNHFVEIIQRNIVESLIAITI